LKEMGLLHRRAGALVVACAVLAALAGCKSTTSLLEAPQVDYKSAGQLPPLEIPPDLTAPRRDNRYVVPETGKGTTTLSSYKADQAQAKVRGDSDVLPTAEHMHIAGRGNERWLVVDNKTPEQLWGQVKDFWQANGFLVRKATPETGIMETDWAENRAKLPQDIIRSTLGSLLDQLYSTSERDMFRTRLEHTPDGRGTEIYISHRGMEEVYVPGSGREQTKWQPRETDPTLEAEFLRRLMVQLGAQEEKAKQMIASTAQQPERAKLMKGPDGSEVLEVDEPFDRAWRRVGLALDRVGFTVEDRDRAKGLYYVRYADPDPDMKKKDEKPGLLDKLAFWKSSEPQVKAEQYRVSVAQESQGSQVRVLGKDGKADATATGHRILSLLHQELK
jgi:outer membrane protein assembly factor BamC